MQNEENQFRAASRGCNVRKAELRQFERFEVQSLSCLFSVMITFNFYERNVLENAHLSKFWEESFAALLFIRAKSVGACTKAGPGALTARWIFALRERIIS